MTKKLLLDCDPGIDDALAIGLAHGIPDLELVGLTTVGGNVELEHTTDNALRLVDFYGMDVQVARGAGRPLVREPKTAADVHGATGLGGAVLPEARSALVDAHAADFIIDTLAAAPGEISLAAVGPLTNIALALRKEPRIAEWAAEFVIMGGSYTRGNTTPAAEFNVHADPEAAAVVFGGAWRTVMIGLDLTHQARATAQVRSRFAGLGRLEAELLTPCLDFYGEHDGSHGRGPAIHDACAVAYVANPALVRTAPARVDVEVHGTFTAGMTVTDFGGAPNADVATELDVPAFWDLFDDAYRRVAEQLLHPAG
ncbi:purine nucleosidase [Saccharopolyspora erythraea NRRL 2338]|uniref:Inosine-uridine preferring nucleoside hydrolase n=2 Tax=Saccharopolyspora erythraea TaxID=1836 RepID=A4F6L4_SACEN|nr:nucleoside hydrolase [Saccharopolyspora erythraea]EQD87241.1 nucleoside hydrolase [Saccharopolyspora erythraea D]PFG93491.1 purine nucleosidase [Saccharopolyspora erythraea NRRL 2338]QRK90353.1 nucleoside hydrolase [Saccharopolyspora erythraea]CAL99688.1 inosine-uridine preferring nucleoside hydrolase [Saccharopolyspora erythraea NRRL 2338]